MHGVCTRGDTFWRFYKLLVFANWCENNNERLHLDVDLHTKATSLENSFLLYVYEKRFIAWLILQQNRTHMSKVTWRHTPCVCVAKRHHASLLHDIIFREVRWPSSCKFTRKGRSLETMTRPQLGFDHLVNESMCDVMFRTVHLHKIMLIDVGNVKSLWSADFRWSLAGCNRTEPYRLTVLKPRQDLPA